MGRVAQLWLLTLAEKVIKKLMDAFFGRVTAIDDILPALETLTVDVERSVSFIDAKSLLTQKNIFAFIQLLIYLNCTDNVRLLGAARWLETQCQADDIEVGEEAMEAESPQTSKICQASPDNADGKRKERTAFENEVLDVVSRISGTCLSSQFDALMLQLFQLSLRAFHKTQRYDIRVH